jgi:hypothetical protein
MIGNFLFQDAITKWKDTDGSILPSCLVADGLFIEAS